MPESRKPRKRGSRYAAHPGLAMVTKLIAELEGRTGRGIDAWTALVSKQAPAGTRDRIDWLKRTHGFGTNEARFITDRAEGRGGESGDPEAYLRAAEGYVEAQYAGKKRGLRSIYEKLLDLGLGLGPDVRACPCQTMVPLYRRHVFAQIKASTLTRVDLGLALGSLSARTEKASERLVATGGLEKGDRITHRIPIGSVDGIDDEVTRWLRTAYDLDR